jgi:N-acetylglucosamine-6-phosphate deacetylase
MTSTARRGFQPLSNVLPGGGMKVRGRHFETGDRVEIDVAAGKIASVRPGFSDDRHAIGGNDNWLLPGLIDIQVNGFGGFDLNAEDVTVDTMLGARQRLAAVGIARWCPTVITGSHERIISSMKAIARACDTDPGFARSVLCAHLEGPWISPDDGARGAHDLRYVRPANIEEFKLFQEAAGGRIRYVTLAPEVHGAIPMVKTLAAQGIIVGIGHHAASGDQIRAAADAGARICTHLGNGCATQIKRHRNIIFEQLAEDRLWASFIPDGHHLPRAALRTLLRAKGLARSIITSDAVHMAGLPPGDYRFGDQEVRLYSGGRINVKGTEILAGSGLQLFMGISTVLRFMPELTLADAVALCTRRPAELFGVSDRAGNLDVGRDADLIVAKKDDRGGDLRIEEVVLGGEIVGK